MKSIFALSSDSKVNHGETTVMAIITREKERDTDEQGCASCFMKFIKLWSENCQDIPNILANKTGRGALVTGDQAIKDQESLHLE